jgi:hypothetical protein
VPDELHKVSYESLTVELFVAVVVSFIHLSRARLDLLVKQMRQYGRGYVAMYDTMQVPDELRKAGVATASFHLVGKKVYEMHTGQDHWSRGWYVLFHKEGQMHSKQAMRYKMYIHKTLNAIRSLIYFVYRVEGQQGYITTATLSHSLYRGSSLAQPR